jgi:hypothetical protein
VIAFLATLIHAAVAGAWIRRAVPVRVGDSFTS